MPPSIDPCRELLAYATHGLLFGFGYLASGHRTERRKDIRTLVFVHGLWANRAGFFPLQGYLRMRGHRRQLSFNHASAGPSVEALALELKRQIDRRIKGGRIDLVGHSLGGLVARYYVQRLGGARRVDRLVTLGAPHAGTHASIYVPTRLVRELHPESELIRGLSQDPPPRGVRCLSIAAGRDLMVLPAEAAFAPFGERSTHDDLGHLELLLSPRVFREVHDFLE